MNENMQQQRYEGGLQLVNGRGQNLVQVGNDRVPLTVISSIEHDVSGFQGWLQNLRLGGIQTKKQVAIQKMIVDGEVDVVHARVIAQTRLLTAIAEKLAEAQREHALALVRNWAEERLRQAKHDAHLGLQRSIWRFILSYSDHLDFVEKQAIREELRQLALDKAAQVFASAMAEMEAVHFKA